MTGLKKANKEVTGTPSWIKLSRFPPRPLRSVRIIALMGNATPPPLGWISFVDFPGDVRYLRTWLGVSKLR